LVKHGSVTLLSVVQGGDGRLKLLSAHAESVPGPMLEIGNANSARCWALKPPALVETTKHDQ
jgi:L-arabinose isomerase